jgi:PAS domain S-box-containing protein
MRLLLSAVVLFFVLPLFAVADAHELLDETEHAWIESLERPLIVSTELEYRPYNFLDEDGELSGVAGDYMRLIGERVGVEFTIKAYPTFSAELEAAKNREVDIIPLIIPAPERKAYLNFTQPAYDTEDRILVRNDRPGTFGLEDLYGMKVALVSGYAMQSEIEREHPEIELVLVDTEVEALLAVSLGQADATISEIGTSSYYIQQEAIPNLRAAGRVGVVDPQAIGTRNDWPILNRIIGKGLASITPEEREEIARRWINIDGVSSVELARFWKRVGFIVAIVFAALIVMFAWSLSLRREVTRRTSQLQRELEQRRKLEAANERLAVAVEQSAEYSLVCDTKGLVEYANIAFHEASGIKDLIGRKLESLAVNSSHAALAEGIASVAQDGTWRGKVGLTKGANDAIKVAMTIAPIFDDEENLDGYVVTARDITLEEKLESRLRQSDKLSSLGTLAGGIAHDFNNLLMPIFGYADMLRKDADVRVAQYVEGIIEASERARDLVKQILIFGRGGTDSVEPLDLCTEIVDCKPLLDALLPPKVELRLDVSACSAVMCNQSQFHQILVNFCSNSVDAMTDDGGVIRIGLEEVAVPDRHSMTPPDLPAGKYNVVSVSDNGVGMDAEAIARIFDPYFTDKPHGDGTGLGLAIVHGIVTTHGGAIQVDSAPGGGTTVKVYLPSVDDLPVTPRDEGGVEKVRLGAGEHILILDDDESVLAAVDNMVQALGYKVSAWSDAHAALDAFRDAPDSFDAILADFKMPQMTGHEFVREAREVRADIPVVIMSGNTSGLHNGGIDYIAKPLSLDEIAVALGKILK